MPTDTNVDNLKINILTEAQYEQIQSPSSTELYLVPDTVDTVPTQNSTNTITSGAVYDAINNIPSVIRLFEDVEFLDNTTSNHYYISRSRGTWAGSTSTSHRILDVTNIRKVTITARSNRAAQYTFLKSYTAPDSEDVGETPDYADGYTTTVQIAADTTQSLTVPSDAKYLYILVATTSYTYKPASLKITGIGITEHSGTGSGFVKDDGSVDRTSYEPALPSKTGNSGKVLAVTEDGTGVEWKEMPLLTGGERLLISADGTYSIDLTDRSVTIINFGTGVTGANITFTLNKPGKRQAVFLSQDKTVGVNVFLSCASANMLWMVGEAKITVTARPSFFEVIHRMAENSLSVLTATAPTEAELFGKSGSEASWEPPAE